VNSPSDTVSCYRCLADDESCLPGISGGLCGPNS
jgi:hypothetical protein